MARAPWEMNSQKRWTWSQLSGESFVSVKSTHRSYCADLRRLAKNCCSPLSASKVQTDHIVQNSVDWPNLLQSWPHVITDYNAAFRDFISSQRLFQSGACRESKRELLIYIFDMEHSMTCDVGLVQVAEHRATPLRLQSWLTWLLPALQMHSFMRYACSERDEDAVSCMNTGTCSSHWIRTRATPLRPQSWQTG